MSIILLILKIIGIVLLSLIGLILFLVMLVLFVPIRYKVKADYDDKLVADVRISYLLHIFSFLLCFDGEKLNTIIRIFGIRISEKKEKQKKEKKKKEKKKEKKNTEPDTPEYTLEGFDEEETLPDTDYSEYNSADDIEDEDETEKGFFGKIKEYLTFLYKYFSNFSAKVRNSVNKVKEIKDNLVYYIDLLSKEKTKTTFKYALNRLLNILKAIKPRKFDAEFQFGFEDPATTGKILSYLAIVYPFIHGNIKIIPEFEEQIIRGNLLIKGRIFIIALLIQGWKLYFNKDIRKLVKEIKRN